MSEKLYFVYLERNGEVNTQKWVGLFTVNNKDEPILFKVEITKEDFELSFDQLTSKYPYKE